MNKMFLLAIDPSIISLGYAVFNVDTLQLITFGTVKKETAKLPLELRITATIEDLEDKLRLAVPNIFSYVVIEKPELWGAYKSVASAQSGALLSLHILVGALFWYFHKHAAVPTLTQLVPVSKWKGQLPKDVTKKRMEKKYNVKFATDDESDACGLGAYYIEKVLIPEEERDATTDKD